MSIGAADVGVLVAALDLKLVRLLRGAMAGQLNAFAPGAGVGGPSARQIEPRHRIEPEPRFEPRKRIEPEPRFEPRRVIHPEPRVEPPPCEPPHEPEMPLRTRSPLEPPWRVVPWVPSASPAQPPAKVKPLIAPPDVVTKGTLIDFFI